MIGRERLISPQQKNGSIFIYASGSLAGKLDFPAGTTYFPPSNDFSTCDRIRVRIEYADGKYLSRLREILMLYRDGHLRKMFIITPGEPEKLLVEPYGQWETYFFNQQAIGYGPIEMVFKITSSITWRSTPFGDSLPWVEE